MPTYEYKCPKGHVFERTVSRINNQRHAKCPVCGKRAERQISGGTGLVFKGSGFYQTDYKRAGEKPEKADAAEKGDKSEKPAAPAKKKDSSTDK
jgi:putative FmdB family regulatory protein